MKKFFMAACALAVMGFVACSKDDNATVNNEVKVNFTVADKPSFDDTRATKSAWADGDKIMVVFNIDDSYYSTKSLILTYNSGTWTSSEMSDVLTDEIFDGYNDDFNGNYKAFHYRGDVGLDNSSSTIHYFSNYAGGDFLVCDGTYTYKQSDRTMTLSPINMKFYPSALQISVKGLDQTKEWNLTVLNNNGNEGSEGYGVAFNYFAKNKVYIDLTSGVYDVPSRGLDNGSPTNYVSTGVNNSDGDVSFWVLQEAGDITNQLNFAFYITDGTTKYMYCKERPEVEGAYLVGGKHYRLPEIKAENIATGTAWVDDKWIQLP